MASANSHSSSQTPKNMQKVNHLPSTKDERAKDVNIPACSATEPEDCLPDNASSISSECSTLKYSQEPYETFKDKVLNLILELYPTHTASDIEIERLVGGGFNRVFGITVYDLLPKPSLSAKLRNKVAKCFGRRQPDKEIRPGQQLIFRTPRFADDATNMDYQAVMLEYLAAHGGVGFPIPKVMSEQMTEGNALGRGYMLQERLPGKSLHSIWESLTSDQKMSAARQISQLILNLGNIRHNCAGMVARNNTVLDLKEGVKLETFAVPELGVSAADPDTPHTFPAESQTTTELLLSLCERWKQYEIAEYQKSFPVWADLIKVIHKLHDLGFLPDDEKFYLCHLDLQLRNLLAEIRDGEVQITGILDWDSAVFAPKFVSRRAPFFLWTDDDAEENDENGALVEPQTLDQVNAKKVFGEMVGEDFRRFAYGPEFIIARRIFQLLQKGLSSSWEIDGAKEIVADFEKLHFLD